MKKDDFDEGNEVLIARITFILLLLIIAVLIIGGIKLFKGGFFGHSNSNETEVSKVIITENEISIEENQTDIMPDAESDNVSPNDTTSDEFNDNIDNNPPENSIDTNETSSTASEAEEVSNTVESLEENIADPQVESVEGIKQEITLEKSPNENATWTLGVDVSSHQGTIDWQSVKDAGIDFAMIRIGYRGIDQGNLVEDVNARYNLQEATSKGIKAGAYFVSTAVNESEAVEEAEFVINIISKYQITYPVAYDCERFESTSSRQYGMSVSSRSACAKAFLNRIKKAGYEPMFYASKGSIENNRLWETSSLEQTYKIWVSWYSSVPFPEIANPNYAGQCAMWQYTDNGIINGVKKPLDINVAYFGYNEHATAHDENAPDKVQASVEATMTFNPVNEMVTAKDKTNLRDKPSQGADSTVMYVLSNGEYVLKTGSSPSGWCRVDFNGITLYAKESYLTSNTSTPPAPATTSTPDAGIKTVFTACDDYVTPKIEVNLRALPSTTNVDAVVVATVKNGDIMHRTGRNDDLGWTRVEYNGQVLYCVTSYLNTVQQ